MMKGCTVCKNPAQISPKDPVFRELAQPGITRTEHPRKSSSLPAFWLNVENYLLAKRWSDISFVHYIK